ncbi:MAG: carboxypeptidase-like regulatory domain-containing protein [Ignavibacteriales bacterium]|nr:carboxypeptidase-like regulatory domain-containing protein [Ignavibacteriales bacterium]
MRINKIDKFSYGGVLTIPFWADRYYRFNNVYLFMAFLLLFVPNKLFAQEKTPVLSGYVLSVVNNEPLSGATVRLNRSAGAITDENGYFSFPIQANAGITLTVSFIGFQSKVISYTHESFTGGQPLNIYLQPDTLTTKIVVIEARSGLDFDSLSIKGNGDMIGGKELNNIPRILESDLFRGLQSLPGITSISDYSSSMYVRGGTPDQNIVQLDGNEIYQLEHAFGLFSVFHTNNIQSVFLSKGGFNAEYGGRLSSLMVISSGLNTTNSPSFVADFSLLTVTAAFQVPIKEMFTLSGSIRRSYIDIVYAKFSKDIPEYYFYDGNLKLDARLTKNDKISLSIFSSNDNLDYLMDKDMKKQFGFFYKWKNLAGNISWQHQFNNSLNSSLRIAYTGYHSVFDFKFMEMNEYNTIHELRGHGSVSWKYSPDFTIKTGFEIKRPEVFLDQKWDMLEVDIAQSAMQSVAFINTIWNAGKLVRLESGFRLNNYSYLNSAIMAEPRLHVEYNTDEELRLFFSIGKYFQFINRVPRAFFANVWALSDENILPSSTMHYICGFEKNFSKQYNVGLELFYKNYTRIQVFNQNILGQISPDEYSEDRAIYHQTKSVFLEGDGKVIGGELIGRKENGIITGWLSYAYTYNKNRIESFAGNEYFTPRYNKEHVLNAYCNIMVFDLAKEVLPSWIIKSSLPVIFSTNFVYASGQFLTAPTSMGVDSAANVVVFNSGKNAYSTFILAQQANLQLPPYIRLDIRLSCDFLYHDILITPYLQVFNIGNRKNVWFLTYDIEGTSAGIQQRIAKSNMLPILPSIGCKVQF